MTQLALLSIGGGVLCYFLVRFAFQRDTAVENRRLESIELSDICARNGLPILSKFLRRYAVGDYSGMLFAARDIRETLTDPDDFTHVVDKFLGIQLDRKLRTVEGREQIVTALETRLGIQIPREVVAAIPLRKLVTEDAAYEAAENAYNEGLVQPAPNQPVE